MPCKNWKDEEIIEGELFFPQKNDPCRQCLCQGNTFTACTTVQCAPPEECTLYEEVEGECCGFHCIDIPGNDTILVRDPGFHPDAANLSLRLVASTVTTCLLLALLIFTIHRYRQRRILFMRRMQTVDDDDTVAYVSEFNSNDVIDLTFPPYEDPPPPYTPPKPPDIDCIEAPPPYQESEAEDNNNLNTGRNLPAECPPYTENGQQPPGSDHGNQEVRESASTDLPPDNECNINNRDTSQSCHGDGCTNNLRQDNSNNNNNFSSLFANLSSSGEVRASCSPGPNDCSVRASCSPGPNDCSGVSSGEKKNNGSPDGNSDSAESAVKRRAKCAHIKRNRAVNASKSCPSYKDGYAQTLPITRSSREDEGTCQMRNSYHASTEGTPLSGGNNIDWGKVIGGSRIKRATVSKLELEAGKDMMDEASDDVTADSVHISYSSNDIPCIEVINELEKYHASGCSDSGRDKEVKRNEHTDESLLSVCSETGEKRKSGNNSIFDACGKNNEKDVESTSDSQLHQSVLASSFGFDNLRSALKADNSYNSFTSAVNDHKSVESDSDSRTLGDCESGVKDNGSDSVHSPVTSPVGTKPKAKRMIYFEPEEIISSDAKKGNDNCVVEVHQAHCKTHKGNLKSTLYPDNCKRKKASPISNHKGHGSKSSKHLGDDKRKRKSEVYADSKEAKTVDNSLMSRSMCTAAEYGFDAQGSDHSKIKPGSSLNSPAERLRREKIKRTESPETFRRISMAYDDANQFKQYGFIDNPNSIENVDNVLREERLRAAALKNESSKSRLREKQSQERKSPGDLKSCNDLSDRKKTRHSSYLNYKESPEARAKCKDARRSRLSEGFGWREECEGHNTEQCQC